jgi:O-methyltransferase
MNTNINFGLGNKTRISSHRYGFDGELRIPKSFRKRIKGLLATLPSSHTARLLAHLPELRTWKRERIKPDTPVFEDRHALYNALITKVLPESFAYLEFGCASGEVVERWAANCPHPASRFWGFDTFTGMPEQWRGFGWRVPAGAWTQNGVVPQSHDPRVAFVEGLFQDSVPKFLEDTNLFTRFDHFVIHIDADLYSAALYVLAMLHPILDRATVLFDEFDCPLDEMKALDDFSRAFCVDYEVLGLADACEKVAIRFSTRKEPNLCFS